MTRIRRPLAVALAALLAFSFAQPSNATGALSNYTINHIIDWFFRGQTFTPPATIYVALATTTPTQAACGTEAAYTGYARVGVSSSLLNWAGTQAAGSTTASTGTSGQTSNNATITFGAPTSGPTVVTAFCIFDASTGGNYLGGALLTTAKTINASDPAPSFAIGALTWTLD